MDYIPPGVFDLNNEKMIFDAASKSKGSAGPSGMDAELYNSENPLLQEFQGLQQGLERGDCRFHKKSPKDCLSLIFAGRLYLQQIHHR